MGEYLPQMIHIGSRKKKENLTILAENVLPRQAPPFYKVLAPPLLDRVFLNFGSRRRNQLWTKSQSFKSLRQNRLGARIDKPPGSESAPPPPARNRVSSEPLLARSTRNLPYLPGQQLDVFSCKTILKSADFFIDIKNNFVTLFFLIFLAEIQHML